jgi:(1->4)-alpha-D-glucan 1-alpha-D-glucosylmutase
VTYKALNFRRLQRDLFLEGEYIPLACSGARENNVVAFLRKKEERWALAAVPRLTAKLAAPGAPLDERVWGESYLKIPAGAPASWTNVFTGQSVETAGDRRNPCLPLNRIFSRFPVALLAGETANPG